MPTTISIHQRGGETDSPNAALSFNGEGEYPITVRNPFTLEEEARLEWYFEDHLRFPFINRVEAQAAAASVTDYGQKLFQQIFADADAYASYKAALQAGVEQLRFEIVGAPEFHQLHWESLKDPRLPQPLTLQAPMIRRAPQTQVHPATAQPSPTIKLLLVVARPDEGRDVGYRTIARPLVEMLRQSQLRVQVDFVRPGSYKALATHLEEIKEQHGTGYYHVVHFDAHGAVCTHKQLIAANGQAERLLYQERYGRPDIAPYEGRRAFIFLESEQDAQSDPVEAGELANLLITHRVPIVVLNACQSGKQVGASETSLGSRLLQAGVQMVLAMGYSVTVSAAELMMRSLYERLFAGSDLAHAIRRARQELFNNKDRRAYFNQTVQLEDWLLPVVYQNREQRLTVRAFEAAEQAAYYGRELVKFPEPAYGFAGRDLDILRIEKKLLARNLLLVRGMGGAGKTTLLHHVAAWWQTTNFVERVFYFGYDERAWARQQLLDDIARKLFTEVEYAAHFQPLGLDAQQRMLTERLRAHRHLLILDNLESITGEHLAIGNTLPPREQAALRGLMADLAGGKTLVLLGSRGGEAWLRQGTFDDNVYDLQGLDSEAASSLAERILEKHVREKPKRAAYRADPDFKRLLALLAGYPLALEVVLANLVRQTPAEIIAALQAGNVEPLDKGDTQKKTESILRCIDYSHGNLSPAAQGLLFCLAPFSLVVNSEWMEPYIAQLKAQPALAHLPFDRWDEVLREAKNWGLISPDAEQPSYLRLQPIFPYFLRAHLNASEKAELRSAVEMAFRQHYDELGGAIFNLLDSKEPDRKQLGRVLARLEYENLATVLNLKLSAQESIQKPYNALSLYLDTTQDHGRGLQLGEMVLAGLEKYLNEKLTGQLGVEFVGIVDDIAVRQMSLRHYAAAEESCQKSLKLAVALRGVDEQLKGGMKARIYHQLGLVAEGQRLWAQAEQYYKQAIAIFADLKDTYGQALTYHQLGNVALEQRQWMQAEQYYKEALAIKIEFKERYAQGSTYHQLGIVAQEQQQWAQAEQYYKEACAIFVEFEDRYALAMTCYQLGKVAVQQGQWAQAEQYCTQALAIFVEFNDRYRQATVYNLLSSVALEQQRLAQARDYLLKALEIFAEFQDQHILMIVLHNLGVLWQASGDGSLPGVVASQLGAAAEEVERWWRAMLEEK